MNFKVTVELGSPVESCGLSGSFVFAIQS